jgi:signal peptidase I
MQFLAKDFVTFDGFPSDATWEAERCAVAADSLRESGRLRLQVRGESMLPTLWPGDLVEIASCSVEDVQPGEIVLAQRDGRFFLHRFLAHSGPDGFFLRGDSVPAPDPKFPNDLLLGRLVSGAPPVRPWSQAIGRLLCHWGGARRLALRLHDRKKRYGHGRSDAAAGAGTTDLSRIEIAAADPGVQ